MTFDQIFQQARVELDNAIAQYKLTGVKNEVYKGYENFNKGQK